MTRWTYGKEGMAFPVQVGERWVCGNHTFLCEDLMSSRALPMAILTTAPTLMYTDPPWGQALLNGFRTKAGLGKADYRWEDMYRKIESLATGMPLWIEGSKPDSEDGQKIAAIMAESPFRQYRRAIEVKYYKKNPSGLFYAGNVPVTLELTQLLRGQDDDDTPGIVMANTSPAGLVVDPCAGRGQTSRQAEKVGWHSLNSELNPNRVSASLARMQNLIGEEPRRVH